MKITILNTAIDVLTRQEALLKIVQFVRDGGTHHIVTANPEILVMADDDPEIHELINKADLITADGYGVLLAARMQKERFPERVTGIELAEDLCALSGRHHLRLYFLGGKPGVAREAALRMHQKYPDIEIVGTWHGYFRTHEAELIADIRDAKPDILLCGLGAPLQDQFITRWQSSLGVPVAIGVGGSLDVLSGRVQRAPMIFRKLRLEWLYRIASDRSRWARSFALPRFVWKVWQSCR